MGGSKLRQKKANETKDGEVPTKKRFLMNTQHFHQSQMLHPCRIPLPALQTTFNFDGLGLIIKYCGDSGDEYFQHNTHHCMFILYH